MRILLLIIQYPPDINSTGVLMANLASQWSAQGHDVSVLTSLPHYRNFRIEPAYRGRRLECEVTADGEIRRLWVYAPGQKSMLNRLVNYLSFTIGATLAGIFWRRSWDIILCTNGSFFSGIAAWLIGAWKSIPFIYNVQDLYPEVPVAAGQLRNRYAIAILKKLEAFMYRKAHAVTVISPALRNNLQAKSVKPDKLHLIPNFVDTEFIKPLPRTNPLSDTLELTGKFVVMHAGNLGYVYDFDALLTAAEILVSLPDLRIVIVGDGVAKPALVQQVAQRQLKNIIFLPYQPRDQLPWLRATADVQVSLYKRGAARHSMPSKIYEIMASGRPVLASAENDSPVRQLIDDAQCGIGIEPEQVGPLASAIETLYRDPTLRARLGASGRRHAEQSYCKPVIADAYQELMKNLVAAESPLADHTHALPPRSPHSAES